MLLTITGLILTALGITWRVFTRFRPFQGAPKSACVFVADPAGQPLRVVLVGPDGADLQTDIKGLCQIPPNWLGKRISVREFPGLRELHEFLFPATATSVVKVVVNPR